MKHISLIIALFFCVQAIAQKSKEVPVKQGKNGVYLLLSDKGYSEKDPLYGRYISVTIQRAVNDDRYKEIGKMAPASSADEFERIIAKDALINIAELKKLRSKDEAWQYVQSHPHINDYGILSLELNLGVALGAYFVDKEAAGFAPGTLVKYKILLSDGKKTDELNAAVNIGAPAGLQKPVFISKTESDSVIAIQWAVSHSKSPDVMFGNVYVKEGNPAEFKLLQRVFANIDQKSDTVRFFLTHFVRPGIQFQYFVRPATMAMQEGMASDTVVATSVNFTTLLQPVELKASDTTNGIYLSWKLDQKTNARKSIILERTASLGEAYKTLVVLPSTALSYVDMATQASVTYYYRIRIATISNTVLPPSSHASAKHQLKSYSPEPPQNIKTQVQKNGVLITWSKVKSPDVAGYFVSRNNGIDTIYESVSLLVKDTFFLDTTHLYGRNSYSWGVRAYTFSDMSSAKGYSSAVQVANTVKPVAPAGNRSYTQPGLVHLSWDDAKRKDQLISGYNIYRKQGSLKKEKLTSAENLRSAGFELISTATGSDFTDKVTDGGSWQYAVTSVDIYGKESEVGFIQPVTGQTPYVAVPEQFSVRKTSKGITIDWDIVKQEGVKSYTIYRRSAAETASTKVATVDISKGQYIDTNVKSGTLYYYSLSASGDFGTSDVSAERFAKY